MTLFIGTTIVISTTNETRFLFVRHAILTLGEHLWISQDSPQNIKSI